MNPKNIYKRLTAIILSTVMATIPTLQVLGDDSQNATEYISEVKIGVGETMDEAAASLKGYTILKNGKDYADLNGGAGGGIGSKGDRVVLLGYKTTKSRTDAITDLAVMNMKGGYSVKDYELLMQQQMTEQIIPYVDDLLTAIEEYRINYNSEDNPENKARAEYVHDALNKLTDDDCGGAGLGDLLLNETKYEMGDEAYEALSDEEKNNHADILTIIAQANGNATLTLESLLTTAADTGEESWVDRFVSTTYDDLLMLYPDMLPTDAERELEKENDDDAKEILSMWEGLNEKLSDYDEKSAKLDELLEKDLSGMQKIIDEYDPDKASEEEQIAYINAYAEVETVTETTATLYADITLKDYLSTVEYQGGTLADFFLQDYDTILKNYKDLYPLVASLSEGQRAGLKFVNLSDLIMLAVTDSEGYKNAKIDDMEPVSIYEGVDRGIYEKGGVALTNEALRAHSAEELAADSFSFSTLTLVFGGVSAAAIAGFGISVGLKIKAVMRYNEAARKINTAISEVNTEIANVNTTIKKASERNLLIKCYNETKDELQQEYQVDKVALNNRSAFCTKLMVGFGIAVILFSAVTLYMTYLDLVDYYKVDYTPIPGYIVDEKDIAAYNYKGEKIIIKNLAAYYKAVECNRAEGDEWYDILSSSADLNGTVGRQWLALYASKNENMSPIVADSLKVVVDDFNVPADYDAGIHMFGSGAAYNLNSTQLVWNNDAKSVYVYFNTEDEILAREEKEPDPEEKETETEPETEKETDPAEEETKAPETKEAEKESEASPAETTAADTTPATEGSGFSGGALALSGGIGLLVGALGAYAIVMAMKKKEE